MTHSLSQAELNRYQKHILLPEIGIAGQEKLKNAKVLVIGAGGLGCPVLLYLVSAGVGTIGIVDADIVTLSNLQRQVLYPTETVGKLKVEIARAQLNAINPEVQINCYPVRFSSQNAKNILNQYEFVIDCTDNLATRYLINDICVLANKPFIYGSIHRFEGQVAVFNFTDSLGISGPSYRCLFPESGNEAPNCSEIGVLGVLAGIIGTYQALEAIKLITGIGQVLSGKLLVVDTLTHTQRIIRIRRNEEVIRAVVEGKKGILSADSSASNSQKTGSKQITATELRQLLASHTHLQLMDVREGLHGEGINYTNTVSIPFGHLEAYIEEIEQEPMVVVYCQSGQTSAMATELLTTDYGLTNVYNLAGGLNAWKKDLRN